MGHLDSVEWNDGMEYWNGMYACTELPARVCTVNLELWLIRQKYVAKFGLFLCSSSIGSTMALQCSNQRG